MNGMDEIPKCLEDARNEQIVLDKVLRCYSKDKVFPTTYPLNFKYTKSFCEDDDDKFHPIHFILLKEELALADKSLENQHAILHEHFNFSKCLGLDGFYSKMQRVFLTDFPNDMSEKIKSFALSISKSTKKWIPHYAILFSILLPSDQKRDVNEIYSIILKVYPQKEIVSNYHEKQGFYLYHLVYWTDDSDEVYIDSSRASSRDAISNDVKLPSSPLPVYRYSEKKSSVFGENWDVYSDYDREFIQIMHSNDALTKKAIEIFKDSDISEEVVNDTLMRYFIGRKKGKRYFKAMEDSINRITRKIFL
tara:strand:- start:343 stop:1260 length:918 start_codon:yes stop_codon:yes gene_type:complete